MYQSYDRSSRFDDVCRRIVTAGLLLAAVGGGAMAAPASPTPTTVRAAESTTIDCLLPGQVRRLGRQFEYLAPRRMVKTSARDCEVRGGQYAESASAPAAERSK